MGGEYYRMWPFLELNRSHGITGLKIAPNANKVFKDLIGHATELGLNDLADTSLALLRENFPAHASLDNDGSFVVRTEITDPSMLYTATFGLLGNNRGEPPMAPASRPRTSGSQEIINAQISQPQSQPRSWFDILTLGIFN